MGTCSLDVVPEPTAEYFRPKICCSISYARKEGEGFSRIIQILNIRTKVVHYFTADTMKIHLKIAGRFQRT
jgi:hypothetical protein